MHSSNPVLDAIFQRRSVRRYTDNPVAREDVLKVLEAASWAPSGLNNQPWRFAILWDLEIREKIAALTRYGTTIRNAALVVAVFMDKEASYDYVKDCQAIGAALQNMLLAIHSMGIGAVWIGEILKNKEKVNTLLHLPDILELMAVVAMGHPAERNRSSHRKPLDELVILEK